MRWNRIGSEFLRIMTGQRAWARVNRRRGANASRDILDTMRLWSIHPEYLDARGLVALWREALLAKAVLTGQTTGYTRHPQLDRFRACNDPIAAINIYLRHVWDESRKRDYSFDHRKLHHAGSKSKIPVTRGQLSFEWQHLTRKLTERDPEWLARLPRLELPRTNPLFRAVDGAVELWERQK